MTLDAVELTGTGGFEPGVPSCRVKRVLAPSEQQSVVDALRRARFWTLPTIGGDEGVDGEHWVIEGRTPDAYHVVDRWSPSGGAYLELGKLFLELAGYRER